MAIATGLLNEQGILVLTSSIPPGQRKPAGPATPVSWSIKKKTPQQYEKNRIGKYAPFFKETEILPIPELVSEVEPKTLSYIITFKDQEIGWNKTGNLRVLKILRHPMPVLLLAKFRYLGCPTSFGGAGCEADRNECLNKTLPASAWIRKYQANRSDRV